jgi:hypothetical protein
MSTTLNDLTHLFSIATHAYKDFIEKALPADEQARDDVVRPILETCERTARDLADKLSEVISQRYGDSPS